VTKTCRDHVIFRLPLRTIADAENAEEIVQVMPRQLHALIQFLYHVLQVSYIDFERR
jgi:hypothetical protein